MATHRNVYGSATHEGLIEDCSTCNPHCNPARSRSLWCEACTAIFTAQVPAHRHPYAKKDCTDPACTTRDVEPPATDLPVGTKLDEGKASWSLLPFGPVKDIVAVLDYGAKKYAPDNWKQVENPRKRYFNATMRHLTAWWEGERNDPESGLTHLAHAGCCLLFLAAFDKETK
jgi:hypothetical protein